MSEETNDAVAQLLARRAKARAARDAAEKRAKGELSEEEKLAREVEAEERAAKDAEATADAVEKHGEIGTEIATVDTDLGVVIVRRPPRVVFRRFEKKAFNKDGEFRDEEAEEFIRHVLVHPARSEFDAIVEKLPGTLVRACDAAHDLAIGKRRTVQGKA